MTKARQIPTRPLKAQTPAHIAIILDGNRRWAQARRVSTAEGYRQGARKVREVVGWCEDIGAEVVTLWALSTRNFGRPAPELAGLLDAIVLGLEELAATGRWRIRLIGHLDDLPRDTSAALRAIVARTADATGMTVNIAVAYDGRCEIVAAVRSLLTEWASRGASVPELEYELTEQRLGLHMFTGGQPDPDLVIRTSGEQRLSGFLPWQTVQSELYFCDVGWPSFDREQFEQALWWFGNRNRRQGI